MILVRYRFLGSISGVGGVKREIGWEDDRTTSGKGNVGNLKSFFEFSCSVTVACPTVGGNSIRSEVQILGILSVGGVNRNYNYETNGDVGEGDVGVNGTAFWGVEYVFVNFFVEE